MTFKRIFSMLLTLTLLTAFAYAEPAVITANTKVYRSPSASSASMRVKKGAEVELVAVRGKWALVERGGVYAYMKASQVRARPQAPDYSEYMKNAQEAIILSNTRVYQYAKKSSASSKVTKGLKVNLLAVNGSWALIERGGVYAFMDARKVAPLASAEVPTKSYPAVITADTWVYQSANTSSRSIRVKKGMNVMLLSGQGDWALIENAGVRAYIKAGEVKIVTEETPDLNYSEYLKDAKDAYLTADVKVYSSADTSSSCVSASKGTAIKLLLVKDDWALIYRNGTYGFVDASKVSTEPPAPDYSQYLKDAKDAYLTADVKVYTSADTSSSCVSASKGTAVKLLLVKGDWALIYRNGTYGFVDASKVGNEPQKPDTGYLNSDKYTNEQKCYLFLTQEAGLNSAAACGILANIRKESSFNPASGSSYYGLIQWGGGRLSNLKSYCASNGYSHSSLEGQLNFLMYELKNSYPSILQYLQSVSNNADGAYDAAYHFCYYYERPANKASAAASRGNLAKDTYYPKYNA